MITAGVDWGSSSFRAYRFNNAADVIDTITTDAGLKSFSDNGATVNVAFEHYLFDKIGHWIQPGDSVLLSGMVTSRTGWTETPYLTCPADPSTLMEKAVTLDVRGVTLTFLPGLSQLTPSPDVIRGEELQMLGASVAMLANTETDDASGDTALVMPGTHSKWAHVRNGSVQRFHTIVTGELFDLLSHRSLIGSDQLCSRYLLACQHVSIAATHIKIDAAALGFQEIIHRATENA